MNPTTKYLEKVRTRLQMKLMSLT